MPYRLAPNVSLLIVADPQGRLHYHYPGGGPGTCRGPNIPWLNDEQRQHFLRRGLVEEVDDPAPVEGAPPAMEAPATPELVGECIAALDGADVPSDAGAPTCRTALRDKGISFSNETIAQAVKQRKLRAS